MPGRPLLISLGSLTSLVLIACQTVPITGRPQLQLLPESEGRPPEFLSTHPADVTRIRQIEQWLPEALQYYQTFPYRS